MRSEIGGFRGDPLEVRGHPVTGPHPGVLSCPEPPEERAEVSHGASWGTAKGAPPGGSVKLILFHRPVVSHCCYMVSVCLFGRRWGIINDYLGGKNKSKVQPTCPSPGWLEILKGNSKGNRLFTQSYQTADRFKADCEPR